MSHFRIWISIFGWAAFAVTAAVGACRLAVQYDPSMSHLALCAIAVLAIHIVYSLRTTARDLGWARKSYAPEDAA